MRTMAKRLSVLFLLMALLAPSPSWALTYFGSQTNNADDGAGSTPIVFQAPFVCSASGAVGELSALVFAGTGAPTIRLAIYDSTGTTLIAQGTAAVTLTGSSPGTWQGHLTQASLTPNPVSLVSGTTYIIAYSAGSSVGNEAGFRFDNTLDSPDTTYDNTHDYTTSGFPGILSPGNSTGATYAVRVGIITASADQTFGFIKRRAE